MIQTELHVFDFDGTLFKSPLRPDWWPMLGWWGKPESLEPPCVPQDPGPEWWTPVVAEAQASIADPKAHCILMTGRLEKRFPARVHDLLSQVGLGFDKTFLTVGGKGGTIGFKTRVIGSILDSHPEIQTLRVWDDRGEHMPAFEEVAISRGREFDGIVVPKEALPVECGPEHFLEEFFRPMGRALVEYQGSGQASNFPYTYGRGPGFGFGTGMGGTAITKPHRGSLGGNKMQPNPTKPYSTEFSDEITDQRQLAWDGALRQFLDGVDSMKRDLSMAGTEKEIDDILASLVRGAYDISEEMVADHGVYTSLLRQGEIPKAKNMLMQGIDLWARQMIADRESIDQDVTTLEDMTYKTSGADRQGRGMRSWS